MSETEKINTNISVGQTRSVLNQKINLKKAIEIIDQKNIIDSVKDDLKNLVSTYPHSALDFFIKNLDKHISNIIKGKKN